MQPETRAEELRAGLKARKAAADDAFKQFKAQELAKAIDLPRFPVDTEAVKAPAIASLPKPVQIV